MDTVLGKQLEVALLEQGRLGKMTSGGTFQAQPSRGSPTLVAHILFGYEDT